MRDRQYHSRAQHGEVIAVKACAERLSAERLSVDIVGAITAKKQAEMLQKLIDQAIANSNG